MAKFRRCGRHRGLLPEKRIAKRPDPDCRDAFKILQTVMVSRFAHLIAPFVSHPGHAALNPPQISGAGASGLGTLIAPGIGRAGLASILWDISRTQSGCSCAHASILVDHQ